MDYKELLESKGFSLNEYPEGKFWEFVVKDDEGLKEKLCKIFRASVDLGAQVSDSGTVILQGAEDFTECLVYYDCTPFDMETEEFMKCVEKM